MLVLLLSAASLFTLAQAQYSCSSVASMSHTMNGCPVNEGFPDCSYIQANTAAICSTLLTSWEIVNGQNCNLRGASYGCIYAAGQYSTTDQFCCPLVPSGGAVSVTPSPSITPSPSETPTVSETPSPSETPSSSVTPTVSETPSPSVTPTVSETPSPSVTPTVSETPSSSVTPTVSVTPSSSMTPTVSETPSSSMTPSPSSTASYINTTIITVIKSETVFLNGIAAAIGISSIFGFGTVMVFCYFCAVCLLRRRPDTNIHKIPEKPIIVLTQTERRSSVSVERRKSQVQLVTP